MIEVVRRDEYHLLANHEGCLRMNRHNRVARLWRPFTRLQRSGYLENVSPIAKGSIYTHAQPCRVGGQVAGGKTSERSWGEFAAFFNGALAGVGGGTDVLAAVNGQHARRGHVAVQRMLFLALLHDGQQSLIQKEWSHTGIIMIFKINHNDLQDQS